MPTVYESRRLRPRLDFRPPPPPLRGAVTTLLEILERRHAVIAATRASIPSRQHGVNGLLVPYVDVAGAAEALEAGFRPGQARLAGGDSIARDGALRLPPDVV